ncbi:ABC transporter substrate-binding protein [Saccharibacillus sacchari]|uniref:ABC transporter substrate-binding protein n=1 Tax=Saccharibacillus sacchari TaxID=456493 RepID=A0ACC6PIT0_9BACL
MRTKLGAGLSGLLLMLALSACGQAASTTPTSEAASAETTPTGQTEQAVQVSPDAKIASMSIHMTNNLLALGIKPVGSAIGGGVGDFLPHVADQLEGTEKLGVVTDPDIEAVLALAPDYIFTDTHFGGDFLPQLEKIAPVISTDLDEDTWREHLLQTASYFGTEKEDIAQTFIAEYEKKIEQARKLIDQEFAETPKVAAIRVSAKELRIQSMERPLGPILYDDLQLNPVDGLVEMTGEEPYAVISKEILPDLDADMILLLVNNDADAQKSFEELEKNPLWTNLKAVKAGHVYATDGQKWLDYSSLGQSMAADNLIDLLSK